MTRARTIRWIALIVAVAALGFFGWQQYRGASPGAQAENAQKRSASPAAKPVPVTIASVENADFSAYLFGLGSVQGLNTVVVRTRVDGQIDKIAFQEGQLVKQGDILAEIDPRPYQAAFDQAVAKKAGDESHLANAKLDLHRYVSLGEFATKQQTDTQNSTVQQLIAQIAGDVAAIANAKTQLDYATIRAPLAGVTGFRLVDQGNIVKASYQTGMRALTNNRVDVASGTIRLKAIFENKDHALWPGQSVSTRLLVKTLKDAVVIPDGAIQHGSDGLYAYAVGKDNKAELRKVTVSQS